MRPHAARNVILLLYCWCRDLARLGLWRMLLIVPSFRIHRIFWSYILFMALLHRFDLKFSFLTKIDVDSPACEYINSVTIIKGKDNIFNEDFHVVHHHPNPNIHWTEYPAHYEQHKSEYIRNQATIFTDCEEGEMLYWLFSEKWDELASHFVDLQGLVTALSF
jgi:hypothetical protein